MKMTEYMQTKFQMTRIPQQTIDQLNQLSCEDVADRLGIEVNKHRTLCFLHDDNYPSLYFYGRDKNRWKCFACDNGGSAIDFVMEKEGLVFVDACHWLCQEFGISSIFEATPKVRLANCKPIVKPTEPEEPSRFNREMAEWLVNNAGLTDKGKEFLYAERHLAPNVIEQLNIKSIDNHSPLAEEMAGLFDLSEMQESGLLKITKGKPYFCFWTPCLLFPYYDIDGNLVGLQSRYLGEPKKGVARFNFLSSSKGRLFNLPIIKSMKEGEDLYVSEGITDCLALLSAGKKAVAIPSASIIPVYDLMDLDKFTLHMYPDQDDAGKGAYEKLRSIFIDLHTHVIEEHLPAGIKDFGDYYKVNYGEY